MKIWATRLLATAAAATVVGVLAVAAPANAAVGYDFDTIGFWNPSDGGWHLRNANSSGSSNYTFLFGPASSAVVPVTGDWDGDGDETPGFWDPSDGSWDLRNANSAGPSNLAFLFGPASS